MKRNSQSSKQPTTERIMHEGRYQVMHPKRTNVRRHFLSFGAQGSLRNLRVARYLSLSGVRASALGQRERVKPLLFLLILSLVVLTGCVPDGGFTQTTRECRVRDYTWPNSVDVVCHYSVITDCGSLLSDCNDGAEYLCMNNVREIVRTEAC